MAPRAVGPAPDLPLFNCVIHGWARANKPEQALAALEELQQRGLTPAISTLAGSFGWSEGGEVPDKSLLSTVAQFMGQGWGVACPMYPISCSAHLFLRTHLCDSHTAYMCVSVDTCVHQHVTFSLCACLCLHASMRSAICVR